MVAETETSDTGAAGAPVLTQASQRRICLSQEGVDAFAVRRA